MKFTKREKSIISSEMDNRCLEMAILSGRLKTKDAKKHFKEVERLVAKIYKWLEEK